MHEDSMSTVGVLVKVEKESVGDIDDIADKLEGQGLKVNSKLPLTGIISGTVAKSKINRLKNVPGVSHVREERSFQLPPMNEETPQ
jgi:hypothetical protein